MGAGIAQVSATAGHDVLLYDISAEARARGVEAIGSSLARLVRRGTVTAEEATATQSRIKRMAELADVATADIIIEAVPENIDLKRDVWKKVGSLAGEAALLSSNTSSLSITEIASFSGRAERFCGMHFFNPVPVLPLVEVIRGIRTSDDTIAKARDFVTGIGKQPIVCNDTPGFIVNRLLIPYLNDAVHALSEGVASATDIDEAMKLGANMPIGPLALADLVGLDVTLAAAESLHAEMQDPKFRVAPLLRQLVRAGKLGRKSGEGFHNYERQEPTGGDHGRT
jgi:3-hydroxybutyryl-CoA dehydrogenase